MLENIKIIIGFISSSALWILLICLKHIWTKNVKLKKENAKLIQTHQIQSNVIDIFDENKNLNHKIQSESAIKLKKIDQQISLENQEDFIEKSNCIFINFIKKDYEC